MLVIKKVDLTYLDLLFLKLDLDILIVNFTVLANVLLQFQEHTLHVFRWVEPKNSRLELI
jgi:hypothetical protein